MSAMGHDTGGNDKTSLLRQQQQASKQKVARKHMLHAAANLPRPGMLTLMSM